MKSRDAQAADWFVALLCTPDIVALWPELQAWLNECPENDRAFRTYERLWALLDLIELPPLDPQPADLGPTSTAVVVPPDCAEGARWRENTLRRYVWATLLIVFLALVPSTTRVPLDRMSDLPWSYETGPHESRLRVALSDHSIIRLAVNTRIHVRMSLERREVVLERGRALFRVENNSTPFEVRVGTTRVVALGTIFAIVRGEHDDVLTIVRRGKVNLIARHSPMQLLEAGEAMRVHAERVLARTNPQRPASLQPVKGAFNFMDTPLSAAVAAFNRYNAQQLEIVDPGIADERVGGQFTANDPEGFARALDELDIGYVVVKSQHAQTDLIRLAGRHP
jgi:transmembrane sensor